MMSFLVPSGLGCSGSSTVAPFPPSEEVFSTSHPTIRGIASNSENKWGRRQDLNLRPPCSYNVDSHTPIACSKQGALSGLSYAAIGHLWFYFHYSKICIGYLFLND